MRRKVNNSEIHEIKRYYEVPTEKVQEWSNTIEELAKQRDQYKKELDKLIEDLKVLREKNAQLKEEMNKSDHVKATLFDERENLKRILETISKQHDERGKRLKEIESELMEAISDVGCYIEDIQQLKHDLQNKIDDMKSLSDENEVYLKIMKSQSERIEELEEENKIVREDKYIWIEHYKEIVDERNKLKQEDIHLRDNYQELVTHNANLIDENKILEHVKIENEYLLNVIKMSENIEIYSDVEERVDDEG